MWHIISKGTRKIAHSSTQEVGIDSLAIPETPVQLALQYSRFRIIFPTLPEWDNVYSADTVLKDLAHLASRTLFRHPWRVAEVFAPNYVPEREEERKRDFLSVTFPRRIRANFKEEIDDLIDWNKAEKLQEQQISSLVLFKQNFISSGFK